MFTIAGNESIDNDKNNLFQGQVEQKISREKNTQLHHPRETSSCAKKG
ncbi:hypothetical protein LW858_29780 (plasmid) [Bacillus cereus]|nr:hypothetical protein [Bacillus cereus]UIJ69735.1 hypothetical protein LW858_29780 [Bacillus cereus]